jgi:hypothetical protein
MQGEINKTKVKCTGYENANSKKGKSKDKIPNPL